MARPRQSTPTAGELEILQTLWQQGSSTVRQVHEVLCRARPRAYTSVMTLLDIMFRKGLVTRELDGKAFIYRARMSAERTQGSMLQHLIDTAFGGSAATLVTRVLEQTRLSPEEIAEVRRAIDAQQRGLPLEVKPATAAVVTLAPPPPGGICSIAHHAAPVSGASQPPAGACLVGRPHVVPGDKRGGHRAR